MGVMTFSHRSATVPVKSLTALRDVISEYRTRRAAYKSLQAELASFTTESEIADLLALLPEHDGPEVEQIRHILTGNLALRAS